MLKYTSDIHSFFCKKKQSNKLPEQDKKKAMVSFYCLTH